MTTRRGFLLGMLALGAAPAIVRAESLMRIWVPPQEIWARDEAIYRGNHLADKYVVFVHPAWEESMRELMITGSATVIYTREVRRHG